MSVAKRQIRARKQLTMRARREIYGYLFIAPFVIGFLVFLIQPLIDSLWMSLCDVQIDAQGIHPQFFRALRCPVDPAGAVQKRILRMKMEVYKTHVRSSRASITIFFSR